MITRKMRLSMAMLTIAASVLTTGNIKADEKDTTNETNTATELIVLDLRSRLWRSLDTVSVVRAVPSLVMEEQYLRAI